MYINYETKHLKDIDELKITVAELTKRVEKLEDRAGLARGRRDKTIVEIKQEGNNRQNKRNPWITPMYVPGVLLSPAKAQGS